MDGKLKFRLFENANLFGQHQKWAVGFLPERETDYRKEMYVVRNPSGNPDDKIYTRGGETHLRWALNKEFLELFKTSEPTFTQVLDHYKSQPGVKALYGKILRYCCR